MWPCEYKCCSKQKGCVPGFCRVAEHTDGVQHFGGAFCRVSCVFRRRRGTCVQNHLDVSFSGSYCFHRTCFARDWLSLACAHVHQRSSHFQTVEEAPSPSRLIVLQSLLDSRREEVRRTPCRPSTAMFGLPLCGHSIPQMRH